MDPCFVLKVDVDTERGLRDGAPRILDLLTRHGLRSSWFVAMGPDRSGVAALRAFRQSGFVAKMFRTRAPLVYPLSTLLRGTLLPSVPIVANQPERLCEIAAAGHELGIHGYDHVRWHDRLLTLHADDVAHEVARACVVFRSVLGRAPDAFAAPGWQCSRSSLEVIDRLGFRLRSDTRGVAPYRPVIDGYRGTVPELPTTLPTLDEVVGRTGRSVDDVAACYDRWLLPDGVNVHTIHTELEGGPYLPHLDALLKRVKDRMPVRTLGDVAAALPPLNRLPISRVEMGRLPGRAGTVAIQSGLLAPVPGE